jgi:hypothetical protein
VENIGRKGVVVIGEEDFKKDNLGVVRGVMNRLK